MKCPICGNKGLKTTNSRSTKSGTQTWRRKSCQKCYATVTTYEKPSMGWLSIKYPAHNTTMPYSRSVLTKSIIMVFDDSELPSTNIDLLIDNIEQKIVSSRITILPNIELIKIVLNTIRPISLGAAVKYMASYNAVSNQRQLNKLLRTA